MKLSIISRYLVREIGLAWLAVTLVLVTVLFTNRLVRYFGEAASGSLPGDMVLQIMGYKALSYTALVLPGSFFLGIILALGRLYRDSEMAAMGACGIGPGQVYKALSLLMLPLLVLVAWLAMDVQPWAAREGREVEQRARETAEISAIRPGRFLQSSRGDGMFYIERFTPDGERMRDVFLQVNREGEQTLVRASEAQLDVDVESGDQYLVMFNGYRYDGEPGAEGWRITRFAAHGVRISEGEPSTVRVRRAGYTTAELLKSDDPRDRIELHWRVSMPIMVLTLGLIAVPLSRGSPRDGRYGRLLLAVLLYAGYSNVLTIAQGWLEDGRVPLWMGLWPVHLLMALLGAVWLFRQYGTPRWRSG
ncbi:MAG: LPS export ABC transporter permease LptF [Aquisalimonadaceae bacterium]